MKKHRGAKAERSTLKTLAFGILFSFGAFMVISLLCSVVLTALENPTGSIKAASLAAFLMAGVISGFATAKYKGEGGTVISVLAALVFIMVMLSISLVSARGKVGGVVFMNYLCYMLTAALGAFLGRQRERKRRH